MTFSNMLIGLGAGIGATGDINWLDWLIIGGQTKPVKIPPIAWVSAAYGAVPRNKPVFLKDNLGMQNLNREEMFPEDLLPIAKAWGKA